MRSAASGPLAFFFQAEDGIRDKLVTGVQTCALPICHGTGWGMMHFASHPSRGTADTLPLATLDAWGVLGPRAKLAHMLYVDADDIARLRSEERRVGKECRSRGAADDYKQKEVKRRTD